MISPEEKAKLLKFAREGIEYYYHAGFSHDPLVQRTLSKTLLGGSPAGWAVNLFINSSKPYKVTLGFNTHTILEEGDPEGDMALALRRAEAAIEAIPTAYYFIEDNTFWVSRELLEIFDKAPHLRYLHFLSFPLTKNWGVFITCHRLSKPGYAGCTLPKDADHVELCQLFQSLVDMATAQPTNSGDE